ncbi:MAG: DUF1963 domain-containing protein [Planctomycetaceae bacterium]|nr:DUF1963 domain-containing protein [Planctomycetaceae bacterium]
MSLEDDLKPMIQKLSEKARSVILNDIRQCVLAEATDVSCKSRFGGHVLYLGNDADIKNRLDGLYLLCDLCCSEIPCTSGLPQTGRILVFAGDDDDVLVRTECFFLSDEDDGQWQRESTGGVYDEVSVCFRESLSLPEFSLTDEDLLAVWELYERFKYNNTRLLGHVASDAVSRVGSADWELLIQIDSVQPISELNWWDNGKLQLLVPRGGITARNLSGSVGVIVGFG